MDELVDPMESHTEATLARTCLTGVNDDLLRAGKQGSVSAARTALDAGANPNYRDGIGYTAMHYAALKGHSRLIRFLASRGANPNVKSKQGCTALVLASRDNNLDVARALMGSRAKGSIRTMSGRTALHTAAACGAHDVAAFMIAGQASSHKDGIPFVPAMSVEAMNMRDNGGATALQEATLQNNSRLIRVLLSNGASQDLQDKQCKRPANIATMRGHAGAARALASFKTQAALKAAQRRMAGAKMANSASEQRAMLRRLHRMRGRKG